MKSAKIEVYKYQVLPGVNINEQKRGQTPFLQCWWLPDFYLQPRPPTPDSSNRLFCFHLDV